MIVSVVAMLGCAACQTVGGEGAKPVIVPPGLAASPDPDALGACYPRESRQFGEEPSIVVRVEVQPDGTARVTRVPDGTSERMQEAVECVVKQIKFTPGTHNGIAVPAEASLPLNFTLDDGEMPPMDEADTALRLARVVVPPALFEDVVRYVGMRSADGAVAARVMREDAAWKAVLLEAQAQILRKTFTAQELEQIGEFVRSPLGQRWGRWSMSIRGRPPTEEERLIIGKSGCVATLVAQEVAEMREQPSAAKLDDDARVDELRARGLEREKASCACIIERMWEESKTNTGPRSLAVMVVPDKEDIQRLIQDGTCPAP